MERTNDKDPTYYHKVGDCQWACPAHTNVPGYLRMIAQGEFTDAYFAQPAADPAAFGMPTEDDGSRDDPLLSDRSWAITSYRPDLDAPAAAPTRVLIAVGEESLGTFTGRTSIATAELLGQQPTVFPSHYGGFLGGEFGYPGQPAAFARRLRGVLDDHN